MRLLHIIGPWVLLAVGAINLLQAIAWYKRFQNLGDKVTNSSFVNRRVEKIENAAHQDRIRKIFRWNVHGRGPRIAAVVFGVVQLAGAAIWFYFRP